VRTRSILPAAFLAVAAAGAARAQPPPDAAQDLAALQVVKAEQDCLIAHARAVDDQVSDPVKIAARMADACHTEEDRLLEAMKGYAARHPGMEAPPARVTDQDRLETAKAAVVQARSEH
jgi:hypothetical protein